ncbi:MAG: hypothetical protein BYD32DRAFT_466695 [Podila humilis]|nr:MAG: hypothetical protein BYD32DRAFT_466695 [Podila humilis]
MTIKHTALVKMVLESFNSHLAGGTPAARCPHSMVVQRLEKVMELIQVGRFGPAIVYMSSHWNPTNCMVILDRGMSIYLHALTDDILLHERELHHEVTQAVVTLVTSVVDRATEQRHMLAQKLQDLLLLLQSRLLMNKALAGDVVDHVLYTPDLDADNRYRITSLLQGPAAIFPASAQLPDCFKQDQSGSCATIVLVNFLFNQPDSQKGVLMSNFICHRLNVVGQEQALVLGSGSRASSPSSISLAPQARSTSPTLSVSTIPQQSLAHILDRWELTGLLRYLAVQLQTTYHRRKRLKLILCNQSL